MWGIIGGNGWRECSLLFLLFVRGGRGHYRALVFFFVFGERGWSVVCVGFLVELGVGLVSGYPSFFVFSFSSFRVK